MTMSANCWVYSGWSTNFCSNIWSLHLDETPLHHQCGFLSISTNQKFLIRSMQDCSQALPIIDHCYQTQRGDTHTHTQHTLVCFFPPQKNLRSEWVSPSVFCWGSCWGWSQNADKNFFGRRQASSTGWVPKVQWFPTQIKHLCRFFLNDIVTSGIFEPHSPRRILHSNVWYVWSWIWWRWKKPSRCGARYRVYVTEVGRRVDAIQSPTFWWQKMWTTFYSYIYIVVWF